MSDVGNLKLTQCPAAIIVVRNTSTSYYSNNRVCILYDIINDDT